MKKLLMLFCSVQVAVSGSLCAMEKKKKERCCQGGVIAFVQRNITTPLWIEWYKEKLPHELGKAVEANDAQKVTTIIGYGVNPCGIMDSWGQVVDSFVKRGLRTNSGEALNALFNAGVVPRTHDISAAFTLGCKAEITYALIMRFLAASVADKREKRQLLELLIEEGTIQSIDIALQHGAEIEQEGFESMLLVAMRKGRQKLVPFLLQSGAIVTPPALYAAIKTGDVALVERLLRAHPDIKEDMAAGGSFEQAMQKLCKKEKEQQKERWARLGFGRYWDDGNVMPCHRGLAYTSPEVIRFLCGLGVDPNWQDKRGQTVLWNVVLARERDTNGLDSLVPIDTAIACKRLQALLECGANIGIIAENGETVVHYFAREGYKKQLKTLFTTPRISRTQGPIVEHAQEAFIQQKTQEQMALIVRLLSMHGTEDAQTPSELAQTDALQVRLSTDSSDLNYYWRPLVEREYRRLLDKGIIPTYQADK